MKKIGYAKSDNIDYTSFKYLFLDRDGVINVERPNDYVKSVSEFIFIEGAVDAIAKLSKRFDKIFIVSNQRGIGRGIFSREDLLLVHNYMLTEIEKGGGKIDNIYYCPDISDSSINRKPNIGMGFQAQRDYPELDFKESIFVGNSLSDIHFANKLQMLAVLVGNKYHEDHIIYKIVDGFFENLSKFVTATENTNNTTR